MGPILDDRMGAQTAVFQKTPSLYFRTSMVPVVQLLDSKGGRNGGREREKERGRKAEPDRRTEVIPQILLKCLL